VGARELGLQMRVMGFGLRQEHDEVADNVNLRDFLRNGPFFSMSDSAI
jgi:hypothetical protein